MRIAVIGCGSIGARHARNLVSLGNDDLVLFDAAEERARAAAAEAGAGTVVTELAKVWDEHPDVAVIATPTRDHVIHASEALDSGCDVLIEKPLSDGLDGVEELVAHAREADSITLVGCNMRHHWAVSVIGDILAEKVLGQTWWARFEFGQYLPDWRPGMDYRDAYSTHRSQGGGIVLDAIHEIDLAVWMFGQPEDVVALGGTVGPLEMDVEDSADAIIRFKSGMTAAIHLDYLQRFYSRSIKVAGEMGTLDWDFAEGRVALRLVGGASPQYWETPDGYELNDMYVDQMRYFLECVREHRLTWNDISTAADTMRIALEIREATR